MPNVTILTPIRDAAPGVEAYRARVESLQHPYMALRVVLVEGDSVDDTAARVWEWAAQDRRVRVVTCNTGKPRYGSVVNADRFEGLAQVFNAGLDAVDLEWSTHVLMLPVDIDFAPDLLTRLLAHNVDMVAPLTFTGTRHYDTWAAWRNGEPLGPFQVADTQKLLGTTLVEMTLIGGTLLMRAEIVRAGCRYSPLDVDHGLCRAAQGRGYRVWADPMTHVYHPESR